MIYKISEIPDLQVDRLNKLQAIDNALRSFGESKNILWMPINAVDFFIEEKCFGEYSQNILHSMRTFVRQEKANLATFEFSVVISFREKFVFSEQDGSIFIGYGYLIDSGRWQCTSLLAEDLIDADIYENAARASLAGNGYYNQYDVKFQKVDGGGSRTYRNCQRLCESPKLSVTILDSDKGHPNGDLGSTASKFQVPFNQSEWAKIFILESRELENLVPRSIMREAIAHGGDTAMLNCFDYLVDTHRRHFFDHKEGLIKRTAVDLDRSHGCYWGDVYELDAYDEREFLGIGFGRNILQTCLRLITEMSPHQLYRHVEQNTDEEWASVSAFLMSWGLCLKRAIR